MRLLKPSCWLIFFWLSSSLLAAPTKSWRVHPGKVVSLDQVLESREDLWGNAAMQETNGASYEFFEELLPPVRYVNARFRHYPIVLSTPGALQKARLISNGSAVNALADVSTWRDAGIPVTFLVGEDQALFGENLENLDGPVYEHGYLPIVSLRYRDGHASYNQETFVSVQSELRSNAVVFVRFRLAEGSAGKITARLGTNNSLEVVGHSLCDHKGRAVVVFEGDWQWNPALGSLSTSITDRKGISLAIATVPLDSPAAAFSFDEQQKACIRHWEDFLARAAEVHIPEQMVSDAWKSSIIGLATLRRGDHMNYSAGNAYETIYEAECGDAVRALMLWGMPDEAREMFPPLLEYAVNPGLRFHDAAFKLQMLAHAYWLTHDVAFVRNQKSRWWPALALLERERDLATGLLPREAYCGDEGQKVHSLNSNANAWRGLRDMAMVLKQIGESAEAKTAGEAAHLLREALFRAVNKSERRDVVPNFMPVALFGEEQPYHVLTASRAGSYWNLMIPYVLGSSIFANSQRETSILRYLQEHGGLCMGLLRFHQHSGLFANEDGLDDLYGLRYVDTLFRRDEPERALVSFYGKLAQGMTRGTFLSAEGTGLHSLDGFGRPMYLPPSSSGNAFFLSMLRSILVQDCDLDNDGTPETLRLLFATPRRWMEEGKIVQFQRMPTAFGLVSVRAESRLRQNEILAEVDLPLGKVKTLLRMRVPDEWRVTSAACAGRLFPVDSQGTIDISALVGKQTIRFGVRH
jgi:hypothetical protein